MRLQRGFTLVELVAVMVLLGILSVVVFPRFFSSAGYETRGFQENLANDIRFAQKLARFSGCDVRVQTTSGSYAVTQRANCDSGAFTVGVSRTGGTVDPISETTPSGITLPVEDIYFDSMGRPRNTSDGSLLTASLDISVGSRTLRIEADTGYTYWP